MGRYLIPGHEYEDGDTITGASMTEHVSEALLKATAISEQILKDPPALTDELLINDNGVLKKITLQIVQTLIREGFTTIPVGAIVDFAGTEAPDNWLFCYGQELLREGIYSDLFAVIGVTYGGNGITTFQLPDLRGQVIAGKDDMGGTAAGWLTTIAGTTLGATGGSETHTLTAAQMPFHQHTVVTGTGFVSGGTFAAGSAFTVGVAQTWTTSGAGSNAAHNNIQPTQILNKIIRYQ